MLRVTGRQRQKQSAVEECLLIKGDVPTVLAAGE